MTGLSRLAALRDAELFTEATWPGHPDVKLKIRSLTCAEVLECRAAAEKEFKDRGLADSVLNADAKEEEVAIQILARVLRDQVDPKGMPFAESPDDLRSNTSPDQRAELIVAFNEHRQKTDPWPSELGDEVLAEIETAVKKKDRIRLRSLGSGVLVTYLLTTAGQRET